MKQLWLLLLIPVLIVSCSNGSESLLSEKIAVRVKGEIREFSFTNKTFSQFYGLTNSFFNDGWMGWTYKEQRIFNDYRLFLNDNEVLRENSESLVFPHKIVRNYSNNLSEELFLPDNTEAVFIKISGAEGNSLQLEFTGFSAGADFSKENNYYVKDISGIFPGEKLFLAAGTENFSVTKSNEGFSLTIPESPDEVIIVIGVLKENFSPSAHVRDYSKLLNSKLNRIENLLKSVEIKSNDEDFNRAILWSVASLDALITTQQTKGIFAGLPWFNNYWGRDTFISLPGATFILGNYKDAREILLSFARYQNNNPSEKLYGRIPNRITLNETIYNTADGTPWFVIQAYNYFKYSADTLFLKEVYENIRIAFDGSVKNFTDKNGFLTHSDADTWMDAVGGNGPWSPRGNRANDIQALWYLQLKYTAYFAKLMNDSGTEKQVLNLLEKVKSNFSSFFIDSKQNIIFDRLKIDDSPDSSLRPNLFFPLNVPDLIPHYSLRLKILANAMRNLVFPYGVLSLTQSDDNFHPFHQYPPYYVKDAAYHNGIIWLWNTGPVVEALCNFSLQDTAWVLTSDLTSQILNRGAVGTLSELTDAFPRAGNKDVDLSGTFSQAWSLAEYLRTIFNSYLGVKPDAPNKALYLIPSLPKKLKEVEFSQRIADDKVKIKYEFQNFVYRILVTGTRITDSLDIGTALINKAGANYQVKVNIKQGDFLSIEIPENSRNRNEILVKKNGALTTYGFDFYLDPVENLRLYEEIHFAVPYLNPELKSLKGPSYKLLSLEEIKTPTQNLKTLFSASDPVGDEIYSYPKNPAFVSGILDITSISVSEEADNYFFELKFNNLHNPGWHNEYGFQLTFAAICIGNETSISRDVFLNSNYTLPPQRPFDKKIVVGGGIEIRDGQNKVIAAYLPKPADIKNPLGSVNSKTVSFSLPKKLLGVITSRSQISVLVGAQDDHGGAGVGEFRSVEKQAGEWIGGGKSKSDEHNIYDFLFIN